MATIPSFAFSNVDAPQLDDKMDVASSPFRQPDDIDIDLESVRDPSVIGSLHDEMIDESADPNLDLMHDFDETFADDDMFDDAKQDVPEHNDPDFNMDGSIPEPQAGEGEDILYEDDEDLTYVPAQNSESTDYLNIQEPQDQHEIDTATPLDRHDLQPPQDQAPTTTNEPENHLDDDDDTPTGQESLEQPEQQSLDAPQEDLEEQSEEQDPQPKQLEEEHEFADPLQYSEQAAVSELTVEPETALAEGETRAVTESVAPADAQISEEHLETPPNTQIGDDTSKTIHPVTVVYLEDEMSLFPPMLGDTSSIYFLSDAALASEPLEQLLAGCREILAGTLDHHDELVLDVPALGLHICEDSKYVTQITLAQILDVYLRLCHNEDGEDVKPLYCYLNSRVSLASQYAYLATAGGEGKTYAEIAADHLDSPDAESVDAETVDEAADHHDGSSPLPSNIANHPVEQPADVQDSIDDARKSPLPGAFDMNDQPREDFAAESAAQDELLDPAVDTQATDGYLSETLAGAEEPEQLDFQEQDYPQGTEQEIEYGETEAVDFVEGELDANLDIAVPPNHDVEDGSASSHTVEGDLTDAALQTEDPEFFAFNEQGEDLFQPDESAFDPQDEYNLLDNEELFAAEDDLNEVDEQDDLVDLVAAEDSLSTPQEATTQNLSEDATLSDKGNMQSVTTTDVLVSGNLSPPLTPKQGKRARGEVEDDDELLSLDLDTPDAKRLRPS